MTDPISVSLMTIKEPINDSDNNGHALRNVLTNNDNTMNVVGITFKNI